MNPKDVIKLSDVRKRKLKSQGVKVGPRVYGHPVTHWLQFFVLLFIVSLMMKKCGF